MAYSLGNFVFDQGWEDTAEGLGLRLLFDAEGLRGGAGAPAVDGAAPALDGCGRVSPAPRAHPEVERAGFACSESDAGAPRWRRTNSSEDSSGAIDLTGDGVDEVVRQSAGVVEILEKGKTAWTSPPDWRVVDLDLGDPNEDGRFELLLAIEKTEEPGEVVSQPFIIGYRAGMYRTLWGGSPVQAPLLEVELGDVDGDGADELVVIGAPPDESQCYVTVWALARLGVQPGVAQSPGGLPRV